MKWQEQEKNEKNLLTVVTCDNAIVAVNKSFNLQKIIIILNLFCYFEDVVLDVLESSVEQQNMWPDVA